MIPNSDATTTNGGETAIPAATGSVSEPVQKRITPTDGQLTYEQSGELMNDEAFRTRCKVAVIKYASAILSSHGNFSSSMFTWAKRAYLEPDQVVPQVIPATVLDPAIQQYGSDITDQNLQTAVEYVVQKQNQ